MFYNLPKIGADIANVCNDAAILAVRSNQLAVEVQNLELAIERATLGYGNSGVKLTGQEKRVVAYHEAGHAVAGWFSKHADKLLKVVTAKQRILIRMNYYVEFFRSRFCLRVKVWDTLSF